MKCEQCGNEFDGRADARYCGGACRAKAGREAHAPDAHADETAAPTVRLAVDLPQPTNALLSAAGFIGRWPTGRRTTATAAMTDSGLESRMQQMRGDWWTTPEYAEVVFRRVSAGSSRS